MSRPRLSRNRLITPRPAVRQLAGAPPMTHLEPRPPMFIWCKCRTRTQSNERHERAEEPSGPRQARWATKSSRRGLRMLSRAEQSHHGWRQKRRGTKNEQMPHCITYQRCDGIGQKQACRLLRQDRTGPAQRGVVARFGQTLCLEWPDGTVSTPYSMEHHRQAGMTGGGSHETCINGLYQAHDGSACPRQRARCHNHAPTASNIGESDGATTRRRSGLGED